MCTNNIYTPAILDIGNPQVTLGFNPKTPYKLAGLEVPPLLGILDFYIDL